MDTGKLGNSEYDIAVIGMAGRFPGADSLEEYWANLRDGVESVFRDPNGADLAHGRLEGIDLFDAAVFGITPRDAQLLDPQQRLFLECTWHALEDAAYRADSPGQLIGLFAGAGNNTYLMDLFRDPSLMDSAGPLQLQLSNAKEFLSTFAAYKLGLRGPALNVQTACSTSLVAIHLACQNLLAGECDIALAGGVAVNTSSLEPDSAQEGIVSPDGRCRSFDAAAQGCVGGSGVGVVVLKLYDAAVADGDRIRAVIKGSAINNDGAIKVGYTAPSVEGQYAALKNALIVSDVDPASVDYIECHGTATPIGDPIEIAALIRAYGKRPGKFARRYIGSVKSNVGHLDAAAGVAGFIKTVLMLEHGEIPPSLHYKNPNPRIDLAAGSLKVADRLQGWPEKSGPRRAAVSSFGIGGTNAHVILQQAQPIEHAKQPDNDRQLVLLSANSSGALREMVKCFTSDLRECPAVSIRDLAFTTRIGRNSLAYRTWLTPRDVAELHADLEKLATQEERIIHAEDLPRTVFMFPGQGAQQRNMCLGLYETDPIFRHELDSCLEMAAAHGMPELKAQLFEKAITGGGANERKTLIQPSLFVIELSLATYLMALGARPHAMIGHSLGEYVAACIAGVMTKSEAIRVIIERSRLVQSLPKGSMLAVFAAPEKVSSLIDKEVAVAAINGPKLTTISGTPGAIERAALRFEAEGIAVQSVKVEHAFHSARLDPILSEFRQLMSTVELSAPIIPYVSNITGDWITAEQSTDPDYWVSHMRQTVRFSDGIRTILNHGVDLLLQVGPGSSLLTLAKTLPGSDEPAGVSCMAAREGTTDEDVRAMYDTLGYLWAVGTDIKWTKLDRGQHRRRVKLPLYPFERKRYWHNRVPDTVGNSKEEPNSAIPEQRDVAEWFSTVGWVQDVEGLTPATSACLSTLIQENELWVLIAESRSVLAQLGQLLRRNGVSIVHVIPGETFAEEIVQQRYRLNPTDKEQYLVLLNHLHANGAKKLRIVHGWSQFGDAVSLLDKDSFQALQDKSLVSLQALVQATGEHDVEKAELVFLGFESLMVLGTEAMESLATSTASAVCLVAEQEYPGLRCRYIDLDQSYLESQLPESRLWRAIAEIGRPSSPQLVAIRGNNRWLRRFYSVTAANDGSVPLEKEASYLVTGGLGKVGYALCHWLARKWNARLVISGRTVLPPQQQWSEWLADDSRDEQVRNRIRKLTALMEAGADVYYSAADATDIHQMSELFQRTKQVFGSPAGVFACAGRVGSDAFAPIADMSPSQIHERLLTKTQSALVLARILEPTDINFVLFVSSISSVVGGLGFSCYAAENQFIDLFCRHKTVTGGVPWLSLGLDAWDDGSTVSDPTHALAALAIRAEDAGALFKHALAVKNISHLLVSTVDIERRIQDQHKDLPTSSPSADSGSVRPSLSVEYAAPETDLHRDIVTLVEEIIGIKDIGIVDNFFELGGDSLSGMQLIGTLRARYEIELPVDKIFASPCVRDIASLVEEVLIADIERMSDEEAQMELASNEGR